MSYEIIYDKQFIKVNHKGVDKYIPFIFSGSNNCYEIGRGGRNGRRARSWFVFSWLCGDFSRYFTTAENMLAHADNELKEKVKKEQDYAKNNNEAIPTEEEIKKSWGYYTSLSFYGRSTRGSDFNVYKALIKTGIKQAVTIEQLKEHGIHLSVSVYCYDKQKDFIDKGIEYKEEATVSSDEELYKTLDEFINYYRPHGYTVYLHIGSEWQMERMIKKLRKREKHPIQLKEVDHLYAIYMKEVEGYFIKRTRRAIQYTTWGFSTRAKHFETEKQANTYHKAMRDNHRFEVRKVEGSFKIRVPFGSVKQTA